MRFSCDQKDLAAALHIVNRAINPSNTLPVLNNILIVAEGKRVFFTTTNLEIAIHYVMAADVKNEGKTTIPARLLTNYINLLSSGDIECKLEAGNILFIKTKKSQTKIKGISADEFPTIPKVEKTGAFQLPSSVLHEMINQVAFASSQNIARPVLSGVLFVCKKDHLIMVATDSYRLSEKKAQLAKKTHEDIHCIVPARTVVEFGKILQKFNDEEVDVTISKNQILFRVDSIELTSRLVEGKYPEYERIIPKETKTRIEVSTEELATAVKKASLFVSDGNAVKLSATQDGQLVLTSDETQVGEDRTEIEAKVEGVNNKIALNAQYFLEFLANAGSEKVVLEIVERLSPAVLKPLKKDDYVHIIMPLKI